MKIHRFKIYSQDNTPTKRQTFWVVRGKYGAVTGSELLYTLDKRNWEAIYTRAYHSLHKKFGGAKYGSPCKFLDNLKPCYVGRTPIWEPANNSDETVYAELEQYYLGLFGELA